MRLNTHHHHSARIQQHHSNTESSTKYNSTRARSIQGGRGMACVWGHCKSRPPGQPACCRAPSACCLVLRCAVVGKLATGPRAGRSRAWSLPSMPRQDAAEHSIIYLHAAQHRSGGTRQCAGLRQARFVFRLQSGEQGPKIFKTKARYYAHILPYHAFIPVPPR